MRAEKCQPFLGTLAKLLINGTMNSDGHGREGIDTRIQHPAHQPRVDGEESVELSVALGAASRWLRE
jgi:hypothetical protein